MAVLDGVVAGVAGFLFGVVVGGTGALVPADSARFGLVVVPSPASSLSLTASNEYILSHRSQRYR